MFYDQPEIDAGVDTAVCGDMGLQLDGTAEDFELLFWETSGDGSFSDPNIKDPEYFPGDGDIGAGLVTLIINATVAECSESDEMELTINDGQSYELPQGWSGISSSRFPFSHDLDTIFGPIDESLVMLFNMDGMYAPTPRINTLGAWDTHSGYAIKLSEATNFALCGNILINNIVSLEIGWNMIPVLSNVPVDVEVLFEEMNGGFVKEIAGTNVYWPSKGINTLGTLKPGLAYFVFTDVAGYINFQTDGD